MGVVDTGNGSWEYAYADFGYLDDSGGQTGLAPGAPPPLAHDQSVHVGAGATLTLTLGSDAATVVSVSQPAHGQATIQPGATTVSYRPDDGYIGADSFTFTLANANADTGSASVRVQVGAPPSTGAGSAGSPHLSSTILLGAQRQLTVHAAKIAAARLRYRLARPQRLHLILISFVGSRTVGSLTTGKLRNGSIPLAHLLPASNAKPGSYLLVVQANGHELRSLDAVVTVLR